MMERIIKPLTPTELEIMEILWRENRPLSALEILELSENRSWKQNSLYPTLQHLQEKNAVVITGYVPVKRKYARTYLPTYSKSKYQLSRLEKPGENLDIVSLLREQLEKGKISDSDLSAIENMIKDYRGN